MRSSDGDCRLESSANGSVLRLSGVWRLPRLGEIFDSLRGCGLRSGGATAALSLDGGALDAIDTSCALALWQRLADAGFAPADVELRGFDDAHRRIVELVGEKMAADAAAAGATARSLGGLTRRGALAAVGSASISIVELLHGHLDYFGRVLVALAGTVARPRRLRVRELFAQFGQVCVSAIPVVSLVSLLIGLVFTYLLGLQAAQYGANIFVVDGVALGLTREFSPLIVATIVAGRSGAAFTAQLGTMKLTEELDAIRTLGLSVEDVLVVPRVLALVIALPLLVFVGNILGGIGSMLIADQMLDIKADTYIERLRYALAPRHFVIGLVKAPVFAFFIAVIGCRMGMSVSRDTRSIGRNTTSTVVQAIVAVILLDALFAVLLQKIGL